MQLHFRTLGDGPPLILLHGLLGSLDNWLPIAQRFATEFTVFAVDQRNHGASPHSAEFSYKVMAGDLHEFIDAQNLTRAHLLGHSMGGKTAMQFALLHPEQVSRLVVVDISPRAYPPLHGDTLAALRALDLRAFTRREQIDSALAASVPDTELRQFLLKNLRRQSTGSFRWKVNLPVILENYCYLNAALDGGQPFSERTLIVRGGQSDYVSVADFELIRGFFPQAELRTIPEAGHWVHADAPEEFTRVVSAFLTNT